MTKYLCTECEWSGEEILKAPSPFDPDDELYGCPKCKSVDSLVDGCDEPRCVKPASCGWGSPHGYRRTCFDHSCWSKK